MTETTSHLVQNLSALVGLLVVTIVFASMGDSAHAGEALAALVGYAAGSRSTHPLVSGAAPIVAAGAMAVMLSGCGATTPTIVTGIEAGVAFTCEGARKICEATQESPDDPASIHDQACHTRDQICAFVAPLAE